MQGTELSRGFYLPVIGALDQISDLTPLLEDAALSQRLVRQLGTTL